MSAGRSIAVLAAAPLRVTAAQAEKLFHAIANNALTGRGIAASAGARAESQESAEAFYALQNAFEQLGALADWVCGPGYSEAGR